jgi:curved DNA-binding protein CbpA
MNTTKYFQPKPTTLEALKKQYRELAFKYHPDKGGSNEEMKAVNAEYDTLFIKLKDVHQNKDGETYTARQASTETPEQFKNIIDELMRMDDITIEIIGKFIWVSGNTKPYKEQLKALKFLWSQNKISWYLKPEDYHKRSGKIYNMEDIRIMYGTNGEVKSTGTTKLNEATA